MSTWIVEAPSHDTIRLECDEVTVRQAGDLWFLRSVAPPPDKLAVVLILARGQWKRTHPATWPAR